MKNKTSTQCICNAFIASTGQTCGAPTINGRSKCSRHGGESTGPKTTEGRQRCAEARSVHGQETTEIRLQRSLASARLAVLESIGFTLGFMYGSRTRGRRPGLKATTQHEHQEFLQKILRELSLNDANTRS